MLPLADASAASLHPFVTDHVEPGATVITDGWQGYHGVEKLGYVHDRRSQRAARARGEDPGARLLPAVHRVASLAKRWLLGTHHGSVEPAHLASYLNEFVFRFNRRRSRSRGMVFYRVLALAAAHEPVRYQDLIATKRPRAVPPTPPQARGHPPSLERPPANRPWRTAGARMGPVKWIPPIAAYGLEDSVYAQGMVRGFVDADLLAPLPSRAGFEENEDWIGLLDLLDRYQPTLSAEVDEHLTTHRATLIFDSVKSEVACLEALTAVSFVWCHAFGRSPETDAGRVKRDGGRVEWPRRRLERLSPGYPSSHCG